MNIVFKLIKFHFLFPGFFTTNPEVGTIMFGIFSFILSANLTLLNDTIATKLEIFNNYHRK